MATVLRKPVLLLTRLKICPTDLSVLVLPDGFLGGSAPPLQEVFLHCISFLSLSTILSTNNKLTLSMIPSTAYISPEAIAQCLAVLPNLESFTIEIHFATPQPVRNIPPPATQRVLPVLTFYFEGAYDYLEDLVTQIDASRLNLISVVYLDRPRHF